MRSSPAIPADDPRACRNEARRATRAHLLHQARRAYRLARVEAAAGFPLAARFLRQSADALLAEARVLGAETRHQAVRATYHEVWATFEGHWAWCRTCAVRGADCRMARALRATLDTLVRADARAARRAPGHQATPQRATTVLAAYRLPSGVLASALYPAPVLPPWDELCEDSGERRTAA